MSEAVEPWRSFCRPLRALVPTHEEEETEEEEEEEASLLDCDESEGIFSYSQSEMGANEDLNQASEHRITQSDEENGDEEYAYFNSSFGFSPLYKMNDGKRRPVSYAALYRYRGKDLKHLNRYEYCFSVQVVETKESNTGKSPSKIFPFGKGLGIENNYHQVLRSKLKTPKFTRSPPPPPRVVPQQDFDESDDDYEDKKENYEYRRAKWREKADRFAHFYLTMFRAEDELYEQGQICTYNYNWETFSEFYHELRIAFLGYGNRSKYLCDLFDTINTVIECWRVDKEKREMLAAHRGRARTMWSAEEKEVNKQFFGGNLKPMIDDDGMDYISEVAQEMTSRDCVDARKHLGHSRAILGTLHSMTKPAKESNAGNKTSSASSRPKVANARAVPFDMELDESKRKSKVKSTYADGDGNVSTPSMYCTIPDLDTKVKNYIKAQDLSADKDIVINIAHEHFKAIRSGRAQDKDYVAPNLLVCGKPGNGKSKIIESLDGIVEIMKVGEQMKNAYMGSAAVGIRGTTLLKSWNIPVFSEGQTIRFKEWNEDEFQALQRRFGHNVDNICAVIIDEISTVQPYMLAYLNARMQKLFNNDKPFGGRMVILFGDFQQKPPTAGGHSGTLPGVVMAHIESEGEALSQQAADKLGLSQVGGYLFSKFRYIKLTTQHRSGDPKHTAMLDKMSDTGVITVEDLKSTYKKLSAKDLASDNFRFATIIVTGNAERREINAWQAKRWAEYHGVNTVRWPRKREERSWRGRPADEASITHALQNACFWEYYVPDAMGYLNTHNINSTYGLANGTEIKYHSLSFEDKKQKRRFNKLLRQAAPGDVIDLDFPPTAINVELFPDFPGDSPADTAKKVLLRNEWLQSNKGSITRNGRVVIPISIKDGSTIQTKKTYIPGCTRLDLQYYYHDSSIKMKDYFPIEPAFSITVDKAQVCLFFVVSILVLISVLLILVLVIHSRERLSVKSYFRYQNILST